MYIYIYTYILYTYLKIKKLKILASSKSAMETPEHYEKSVQS